MKKIALYALVLLLLGLILDASYKLYSIVFIFSEPGFLDDDHQMVHYLHNLGIYTFYTAITIPLVSLIVLLSLGLFKKKIHAMVVSVATFIGYVVLSNLEVNFRIAYILPKLFFPNKFYLLIILYLSALLYITVKLASSRGTEHHVAKS